MQMPESGGPSSEYLLKFTGFSLVIFLSLIMKIPEWEGNWKYGIFPTTRPIIVIFYESYLIFRLRDPAPKTQASFVFFPRHSRKTLAEEKKTCLGFGGCLAWNKGLRWEFIKENKKTRTRPRKWSRKKERKYALDQKIFQKKKRSQPRKRPKKTSFFSSYFLVFFYKFPPLAWNRSGSLNILRFMMIVN